MLAGLDVSLISAILTRGTSELLKLCVKHFDTQEKKADDAPAEDNPVDIDHEDIEAGTGILEALGKICNASCGTGLSVRILRSKLLKTQPAGTAGADPAVNLQHQLWFMTIEKLMHRKNSDSLLTFLCLADVQYTGCCFFWAF